MKKVIIDGTALYVGSGKEISRLLKKAIKAGYYYLYAELPFYAEGRTYCLWFKLETPGGSLGTVCFDNFLNWCE